MKFYVIKEIGELRARDIILHPHVARVNVQAEDMFVEEYDPPITNILDFRQATKEDFDE